MTLDAGHSSRDGRKCRCASACRREIAKPDSVIISWRVELGGGCGVHSGVARQMSTKPVGARRIGVQPIADVLIVLAARQARQRRHADTGCDTMQRGGGLTRLFPARCIVVRDDDDVTVSEIVGDLRRPRGASGERGRAQLAVIAERSAVFLTFTQEDDGTVYGRSAPAGDTARAWCRRGRGASRHCRRIGIAESPSGEETSHLIQQLPVGAPGNCRPRSSCCRSFAFGVVRGQRFSFSRAWRPHQVGVRRLGYDRRHAGALYRRPFPFDLKGSAPHRSRT